MFQASSPKYSSHRKMQKGFACFEGLRLEFCGILNLIYRRESVIAAKVFGPMLRAHLLRLVPDVSSTGISESVFGM